MIKKLMKDNSGNALIVAVMVMFVAFIMVMSFSGSVTSASKLNVDAAEVDESYLIAKSGMRFFEEEMVGKDIMSCVGHEYQGKIDPTDPTMAHGSFRIKVEDFDADNLKVICWGKFAEEEYMLYKIVAKPESTTEISTETTTTSSTTTTISNEDPPMGTGIKKAANIQYAGNGKLQFNFGVIGPSMFTSDKLSAGVSPTNLHDNITGGVIISNSNITMPSSSGDNTAIAGIICAGTFTMGHSMTVDGEVYTKNFSNPSTSGTVINGDVWVYDSFKEQGGITINGDVHVGGDALVTGDFENTGHEFICAGDFKATKGNFGDVYVAGNVQLTSNTTIGTLYLAGSESEHTVKLNGATVGSIVYDCGYSKFDNIESKVRTKIAEESAAPTKPVTNMPDCVYETVYNSVEDIRTMAETDSSKAEFYEENGKKIYVIKSDCTINFSIQQAVCDGDTNKNDFETVIKFDTKSCIDVRFAVDMMIGYNGKGGHFLINDHNHLGLIRFYLDPGIDVGLNAGKVGGTRQHWPIEPIGRTGAVDYNYVPNLYVFSLDPETNNPRTVKLWTDENSPIPCFPGYWLTPNLSIGNTGASPCLSSSAQTMDYVVSMNDCPLVHGMLATHSTSLSPTQNSIIYFDPDDAYNQHWKFDDAVAGVYQLP